MTQKKRFPAGSLDIRALIRKGRIENIRFYGDYLAVVSPQELEEALVGVPFDRSHFSQTLDRFPLRDIFGGITKDDILEMVF